MTYGMYKKPRLLTAALDAADRGWPVFPVIPYGKRPAISGWQHHATCNPAVLAIWWQHAPYNIGIACGPARLLVLDLDRPTTGQPSSEGWLADDVHCGRDVLAVLARQAGQPDPRSTYTVATPRGEHRYFTVPVTDRAAARSTAGVLGWLVDTRGAGGYVVAAGSVRRPDGRNRYYHRISSAGVDPAQVPAWLLGALTPLPGHRPRRSAPPRHPDPYVRAVLQREVDRVHKAQVGTRNTTVFHAARRLSRLAAAGLLNDDSIVTALTQAAGPHLGIDGFTDAEVAAAISNGLDYGRRSSTTALTTAAPSGLG